MLKIAALTILFLVCGLCGAFVMRQMQVRVRELEAARYLLGGIKAQLQYSRAPLLPMLRGLAEGGNAPAFLTECVERMERGEAFPPAWRGALEAAALPKVDRLALAGMAETLGATDAAGQMEAISLYEKNLDTLIADARHTRDTRGKSAVMLGVLAGITVAVLFI
ncbi:MAG: stage III sporulation protein AB [Oscillospiraceae bacterium]|nr:stage III sporulation protein AB [Oscillospiraceae bacterium]